MPNPTKESLEKRRAELQEHIHRLALEHGAALAVLGEIDHWLSEDTSQEPPSPTPSQEE